MIDAFNDWDSDVKSGSYPSPAEAFHMDEDQVPKID
jgi:ketopantoate hydroxymethyltransferase